jgi:hypothetical protein
MNTKPGPRQDLSQGIASVLVIYATYQRIWTQFSITPQTLDRSNMSVCQDLA